MWPLGPRRRDDLGRRGEAMARRALKHKGLKLLAENYRCPKGEIDLIFLDTSTRRAAGVETLVFVEVKTRTSDEYTSPEFAVDSDKQRRIRTASDYYVSRHDADDYDVRYDIVSIVARDGAKPQIEHIPDAF